MRRDLHLSTPAAVIAAFTARRAARSGVIWGTLFGSYVVASASGYAAAYPDTAARMRLARSLAANSGLAALLGPARHLETVAGFATWRCLGVLSVLGAIWGLLAATRMLRGEEDTGRWELLLAGRTTRRRAAAQVVAGLAAGWVSLWTVTAMCIVADGRTSSVRFSTTGSLFFATAVTASAAVFLAVGVVVSELAATRRQANGIGAAVIGVAYLVRMVADSGAGAAWLRWASPLGWVENLHPLIGSRPASLIPIVLVTVALCVTGCALAAGRDLGASALPARDAPPPRTRLLRGPEGLAVRLLRPVAMAWIGGLGVCGVVLGLVAQSSADAVTGSAVVERALARLGGYHLGAAAYLGITFLFASSLLSFAAAGQIASTRAEEADGYLDHLLAGPVGRRRWLSGRLALAAAVVAVAGLVAGVGGWLGAASQHAGVGFGQLIGAGLNIVPPAVFVLGVGALAYGVDPRHAPQVTYALVAWSFLIEVVAATVKVNRWVLDTSVLHHVTPVPAAPANWTSAGALIALGAAAAAVGVEAFRRRDLLGP